MPASAQASIALLHTAMVDLVLAKEPVSAPVVAALRAVPRDLFLPDASTEEAYKDDVVVTKWDVYGAPLSAVSRPSTVAATLEQLRVEPGQRILEIGSGGYTAALLAELAGPTGHITTIDIDQSVVHRTHACLDKAGYTDVTALINDGYFGFPLRAPYDRIVVTVNAPDIPPAWTVQLVPGGRIVIPLQLRGLLRTVAFTWDGEVLASDSMRPYGFVRLQGAGARVSSPRMIRLTDGVHLDVDDGQDADPDALRDAISGPSHTHSAGVSLSPSADDLPSLDLWLATVQPTYGRLHGTDASAGAELPAPTTPAGVSACWSDDSLAYLTFNPTGGTGVEIGVVAYGPDRYRLADLLTDDVRMWDAERRGGPDPTIRVYPTEAGRASAPAGRILTKPSAQLLITWG
ncbi:methyltransferase, FxLD system [Frankia sp. CcI49]|uniref:methyltransferase, FxLD system n=1 Tax=unclassified Frankia TaxID=2632575 RepID=UPI0006CA34BD|nr:MULTISPECIES: methyltransferase, FxLD system [unclassified Frankia]KPM54767.1 protein-L-isoaspartate(D-aspartate) O-methyltransferase [Frankia sp. R43]ONH61403.1 methyltransferase, FxLD system [Frankia sp. CcI49]